LKRTSPPTFCEDEPTESCTGDTCTSGDCVSYLVTVGGCDCEDVENAPEWPGVDPPAAAPPGAAPPRAAPPHVIAPLAHALGVDPERLIATAVSEDGQWIAAIAPAKDARESETLPETCRTAAGSRVVAIAATAQCSGTSCKLACPDVGAGEVRDQLAIVGSQVRFLQDPAVADAERTGIIDRIVGWFGRLFGADEQPAVAARPAASLRLVDARHTDVLTTVPDVLDATVRAYDPMRTVRGSGATRFRVRAGRCVSEGRVLGIPSVCHPQSDGECPRWATCEPDDVTVVLDLSVDRDDDGIPDRLDPAVSASVATLR
jgi:hypothetical protein